ncbi:MAG TPA: 2OG-Fe(II) oxygenase family protein [Magnetospirillaceae bacterium]|jgi:isopenicillin N synthase-like dioxygenase
MDVSVVDFRNPEAPARFADSLRRTGFGVIKNHPIPQDLVQTIYREWLTFFDNPAKEAYAYTQERRDGYYGPKVSETAKGQTKRDLKEYFHIFPGGRYPAEVSDAARRYYGVAGGVAATLLGWVQAHTPPEVRARFSRPLPAMIENSDYTLLRILRYPPMTGGEEEGAQRAAAHEDINLLTVLPAASDAGLQVKDSEGRWYDVPGDFGTLIVNAGDMLKEASSGYYPSTSHRVLNPAGEARFRSRLSAPLFLHPRSEVVLSERHTAGSYLDERLRQIGVKK